MLSARKNFHRESRQSNPHENSGRFGKDNQEPAFFQNPSFQTLSDNIQVSNSNARESMIPTSRNPSADHVITTNSNVNASNLQS